MVASHSARIPRRAKNSALISTAEVVIAPSGQCCPREWCSCTIVTETVSVDLYANGWIEFEVEPMDEEDAMEAAQAAFLPIARTDARVLDALCLALPDFADEIRAAVRA